MRGRFWRIWRALGVPWTVVGRAVKAADPNPICDSGALHEGEITSRSSFGKRPAKVPRLWVVALTAMLLVYLVTGGVPRLFDQIDGQYAGAAREMMERGDWLTPTQNGVPRLQKPPLVYWGESLSM